VPLLIGAELYKLGVGRTPASSFVFSLGAFMFICATVLLVHGRPMFRHFLFPLLFFWFAVPPPRSIWSPIVLWLQSVVTEVNVNVLNLIGIPAERLGHTIHLSGLVVAVDEACSGVRSLQSCLMAAVFVAYLVLKTMPARIACVFLGTTLALLGNVARSCWLCLAAHHGGSPNLNKWHDVAGWSILAFTVTGLAIGSWGLFQFETWVNQRALRKSGLQSLA